MYNSIYPINITRRNYAAAQKNSEQTDSAQNEEEQRRQKPDLSRRHSFPNGEKTTIDYSKSKINVAQIITDFNNTAAAIGAPQEISAEVDIYLNLIQKESEKSSPSKEIILGNFKNASKVMDEYISTALNKPSSKVVEDWIDALFLQNIDCKADPSSINPDFKINLPEKKNSPSQIETATEENKQADVAAQNVPLQKNTASAASGAETVQQNTKNQTLIQSPELKKAIAQAKKLASERNPKKALETLEKAEAYAATPDSKAVLSLEKGRIFDDYDMADYALECFNQAVQNAEDLNLKTRAHLSMARIYDDFVIFEPALDHFHAAIGISGIAENFKAQTKALSETASMFTSRFDKQNAIELYSLAQDVSEQVDEKTLASVLSKTAQAYEYFQDNSNALSFYSQAVKGFKSIESNDKVARNYESASRVMLNLGNEAKAKSLLQKAHLAALKSNDTSLIQRIQKKIELL